MLATINQPGLAEKMPLVRMASRPDEVDFVIQNPYDVVNSDSSDRLIARGYTAEGRWIICVYEEIDRISVMPITAYEPTKE